MTEWKTAAEWAGIKLVNLAHTRQGVERLAKEAGWRDIGPERARKRKGRGGGWEYHVSCLPARAQADWHRRQRAAEADVLAADQATAVAAVVKETPESISARRRQVMEARAAVLIELQKRAVLHGGFDRVLMGFLAEAKDGVLSETLAQTLAVAMDRARNPIPSRRTVYNWHKANKDKGISGLIPARSAQQSKQDHPEWLSAVLRFYCRGSKVTLEWALEQYRKSLPEGAVAPSYDQLRRAMKGLQGSSRWLDAFKGREGPLALKARLAFTRRSTDGIEPTEIYTSDGKTFDAYVGHPIHGRPFRPEITTILDVASRKCVGWSVDLAENSRGTADALRVSCQIGGIPAIFYTDRGAGFRNDYLDHDTMGVCARLSITTTHSLPYLSQSRGLEERSHRTIWTPLAKSFPSYCGDDMDRETFQRQHKAIAADIKQFGSSRALPTWDEFIAAVQNAIAEYNDRPHRSLRLRDPITGRMRKASPNEFWADFEARGFEAIPLDADEADDLFRPYFKRVAKRAEVVWNNNKYFDLALEPYNDQEVIVGVDIHDASRVWVRRLEELDGKMVPGALICVARFAGNSQRYMPHSFTDKAKENRAKGQLRRVDARRDKVLDDARGVYFIEGKVEAPAPFIDLQAATKPEPVALHAPAPQAASEARETPLHDDPEVDLALRVLADPSLMTPGWQRLLEEKMGRPMGRRILERAGVNLWDLQDLIRSAPDAQHNKRTVA